MYFVPVLQHLGKTFCFKENFEAINILSFKQKFLYQHDILAFCLYVYNYQHCLKNQGKKHIQRNRLFMYNSSSIVRWCQTVLTNIWVETLLFMYMEAVKISVVSN